MITIRLANSADAQGMLNIYAPYIETTSLTFEMEVPTVDEFAQRINHYLEHWPWLVCEAEGKIVGYAYASRYRERVAYQWSVECSVYIHSDFQKAGVGRSLYLALFAILQQQGFNNVYAVINLPNDKSIAFHETLGFQHFATFEKVGYKLGQWKNVGWWQLQLNEYVDEPPAPTKFAALNKDFLPTLFAEKSKSLKR